MNYIKKFMEDNGLVEGEVFDVLRPDNKSSLNEFKFVSNMIYDTKYGNESSSLLYKLLTEECTVVKKPFIPKNGECYCIYDIKSGKVLCHENYGNSFDLAIIKLGLAFRTKSEAFTNKNKTIEILNSK